MKKLISVILSAVILCSLLIFPTSAADLPESEHNYKDNFYGEWEYTYPENVEGLFVYFSDDTYTERGDYYDVIFGTPDEIDFEDVIKEGSRYKVGDYISVFDGDDELVGYYQGAELTGDVVFVPGSTVKITLTTDAHINEYGFKVEKITPDLPEGEQIFRYHLPNGKTESRIGEAFDEYRYKMYDGKAIIGWTLDEEENSFLYSGSALPYLDEDLYDFYAVTTPVQLNPEDVYSFDNSYEYFDIDGKGNYYMTKDNYIRLITSACVVHGVGPLALPGIVTSAVLIDYKNWNWGGSCIGFTSTVCQQKKGILDVVGTQEGATCMRDLKPTPELISLINYYNGQSFTSLLLKNKALAKYPEEYKRQLQKMFESAKQGNLVLLEFFTGSTPTDGYHGYAISGAYTDHVGNHVLLYYDDNHSEYATQRVCESMTIAPDYSYVDDWYCGMGFVWTDEFEGYRSLDINKSIGNPFIYRFELLKHFFETLLDLIRTYIF